MNAKHTYFLALAALLACVCSPLSAQTLSAGGHHALRISGGSVLGQGDGTYGQLGANPIGSPAIVAGLSGITDVAAGGYSSLVLQDDGTVWYLGEFTLQHTTPHGTPDPVAVPEQVLGLSGIDAIAAGRRHFLALDADGGELYAWGHNGSGQIGNGALLDIDTPVAVLSGVAAMAAGDGFSLAVKTDGTVWAWGRNHHGQLGLGDRNDRSSPTLVSGVSAAQSVAAGGQHSLILLSDGSVLACGNNDFGQLGLGNYNTALSPTVVSGLTDIDQFSAGTSHSAALDNFGNVWVWGRNFEGQGGGGSSSPVTYTLPVILGGYSGQVVALDCGDQFTLLRMSDDSVLGMGSNADGQLDGVSIADQDNSQKVLSPMATTLAPDLTAPQVSSLSPLNQASGVLVSTELQLSFDDWVQKGSGQIRIKERLANDLVVNLNVSSGAITVDGNEAAIALPADLDFGTAYYVEIDAGAFTDLAGNAFAGIAGASTWSFQTRPEIEPSASLIAHYTFDQDNAGTTPDATGASNATLGARVQIVTGLSGSIGEGSLEILASDSLTGPSDGAVTSNSFSWSDDARTLTFWWRAQSPNTNTSGGAYVSFGDNSADGSRFELKESSGVPLRVEVQGAGTNASAAGFDDGNWHFAVVTVPNNATLADVAIYSGVRGGSLSTDLNGSSDSTVIATGTGPLAFGDSILNVSGGRVPRGYLDDFQLYDRVLSSEEIDFLYENPGRLIGTPINRYTDYIQNPAFGLSPTQIAADLDPDGDGLSNAIEAWMGSNPAVSNPGIQNITTDGTTTNFSHPTNVSRPSDLVAYYQWSPDLSSWYIGDGVDSPDGMLAAILSLSESDGQADVTIESSVPLEKLFLRIGVDLAD